jgi:hypothetical protein
MNLKELKEKGGFVDSSLVKKAAVWEHDVDGEAAKDEVSFFVRRLAFGDIEKMLTGETDKSRTAELIAESIRLGEKGKERLTYDDAYQLEPTLAKVFADAIREVNEMGKRSR